MTGRRIGRRPRAGLFLAPLAGLTVVAGCTTEPTEDAAGSESTSSAPAGSIERSSPTPSHLAGTEQYVPGVEADVYLPDASGTVPVVVLVPGGAWRTADRAGLAPLAEHLVGAGMVVVNATYRAAETGVRFPVPVQDVSCAVAFAAARAASEGFDAGPLVAVGHSAGAHLAVLATLGGHHFRGECPWPPTAADAVAGLAGIYDVADSADIARPLFGVPPSDDAAAWEDGNAVTWAPARASVPVLLAHGDADGLVPVSSTTQFADVLEQAGHPVDVEVVAGADHHDVYAAATIGPLLEGWIESLH